MLLSVRSRPAPSCQQSHGHGVATQQRERERERERERLRLRLRLRLRQIVLVVPSCLSWALPDFLPTMVAVAARLQRAGPSTRRTSLLLLPIPSFWQFQWLECLLSGRLMLPVTSWE